MKAPLFFTLVFLIVSPVFVFSQVVKPNFEWVVSNGGNQDERHYDLEIDSLGNVYTLGTFEGVVDFDPGSGVQNHTAKGPTDIFIQKLDSNGNLLWVKTLGGYAQYFEVGVDLYLDNQGDILICGVFDSIVDFDPGVGVHNETADGFFDSFILKLDSEGNFLWVKDLGDTYSYSRANSIITDNNNNIIVSGMYMGLLDFDMGVGQHFKDTYTSENGYILKLTPTGDFIWAKDIGGNQNYYCEVSILSIEMDDNSQLFFTGRYRHKCDFDPGIGKYYKTSTDFSNHDAFVLSTDSNGVFNWVKTLEGMEPSIPYELVLDNVGDIYISGVFRDSIDLDPGANINMAYSNGHDDAFIVKLSNQGNYLWSVTQGGEFSDETISGLGIDSYNNVYIVGGFYGNLDLNPDTAVFELSSPQGGIYIQKLNSVGGFLWAEKLDVGYVSLYYFQSIKINDSGNIYLSGTYKETVDFDIGSGTNNVTSNGKWDVFVTKWSQSLRLGVLDNNRDKEVLIYPIPSSNKLNIVFKTQNHHVILLYNSLGNLVLSEESSNSNFQLNLNNIPSGTYFIRLSSEGNIITRQIVKL